MKLIEMYRSSVVNQPGEVDMVELGDTLKPIWALEIKWSNRYVKKTNELRSLIQFCKENELNNPIITTLDKEEKVDFDGLTLQFYL